MPGDPFVLSSTRTKGSDRLTLIVHPRPGPTVWVLLSTLIVAPTIKGVLSKLKVQFSTQEREENVDLSL